MLKFSMAMLITFCVGLVKVCIDWLLTGASSALSFIITGCLVLVALASWIAMERWWAKGE